MRAHAVTATGDLQGAGRPARLREDLSHGWQTALAGSLQLPGARRLSSAWPRGPDDFTGARSALQRGELEKLSSPCAADLRDPRCPWPAGVKVGAGELFNMTPTQSLASLHPRASTASAPPRKWTAEARAASWRDQQAFLVRNRFIDRTLSDPAPRRRQRRAAAIVPRDARGRTAHPGRHGVDGAADRGPDGELHPTCTGSSARRRASGTGVGWQNRAAPSCSTRHLTWLRAGPQALPPTRAREAGPAGRWSTATWAATASHKPGRGVQPLAMFGDDLQQAVQAALAPRAHVGHDEREPQGGIAPTSRITPAARRATTWK
jgi:hypothetical protein